jgi:transcriptional regulator with XRE-family HTH domain
MRPSRNSEFVSGLGVEVKVRRGELELTQEDLAGRMEIDRPYISLVEVGRKQPTISVLYALAGALEMRFEEFARRVDARYRKSQRAATKKKP